MIVIAFKGANQVKQAANSVNQTTKIVENVKQPSSSKKEKEDRLFYCQACGKSFKRQKGNFPTTQSPMFKGNNGYTNMCKNCVNDWFDYFIDTFDKNEEKAMDRMSSLFDWYYNDSIMASTRKISADRSRVGAYPSKMNLPQYNPHNDKSAVTYLDTIKDKSNNIIRNMEDVENSDNIISKAAVDRWGFDLFEDTDYKILEEHYKMLKKQNPNCDNNQEIFVKDLCYIKLQQINSMKDKKTDDFKTFTQLYRETFKQAGLKTVQETDDSNDQSFGVTLATISQYTPEEYYKSKDLYKDYDGLGDYISRFITRPLKNLQFGSNERDFEYQVKKDGDDDEK